MEKTDRVDSGRDRPGRKGNLTWLFGCQAALYAAGLLLGSGMITKWGEWYSGSTPYRDQTDAFFHGRLALSDDVRDLRFDETWSEQGVHQVWGLGVPLWRFPFEALARLSGCKAFPDRIALGLFALLVGFAVLKVWVGDLYDSAPDRAGPSSHLEGWRLAVRFGAGFLILLWFPPFLTLLQAGSHVWEEAVSYEYLFAVLQLTLLIAYVRRPNGQRLCLVCGLAGMGGLIRPTLVFYGFGTTAIAVVFWALAGPKQRSSPCAGARGKAAEHRPGVRAMAVPALLGLLIFCVGGAVLWAANLKRFGSGFEFGHKLNLNGSSESMYATRFENPFQDEPIAGAAKELFGALFLDDPLHRARYKLPESFPGQSQTFRLRSMYFRTYDLVYLPWILLGWSAALAALPGIVGLRGGRGLGSSRGGWAADQIFLAVAGLWSLLAAIPLVGFYLYTPAISSRYLVDLAPAFAAALASAWLGLGSHLRRRWKRRLAAVILCGWMGAEFYLGSASSHGLSSLIWKDLTALRTERPTDRNSLPVKFNRDVLGDGESDIPFDRTGWDPHTGSVRPLVTVFVKDPAFLELELETQVHGRIRPNPEDIRAKVGLEPLQRERIIRTKKGWKVRFSGPHQRRWQTGLQSAFVATVPKEFMAERTTPWVLKSVSWRDE